MGIAAEGEQVHAVARTPDGLLAVVRQVRQPRRLVDESGKVLVQAPGFEAADGIALFDDGSFAWTPREGGPIEVRVDGRTATLPGTDGLGAGAGARFGSTIVLLSGGFPRRPIVANLDTLELLPGVPEMKAFHLVAIDATSVVLFEKQPSDDAALIVRMGGPGPVLEAQPIVPFGSHTIGFTAAGERVYADTTDEATRVLVGSVRWPLPRRLDSSAERIVVDGVLVYWANGSDTLVVLDLTDGQWAEYALPDDMAGGYGMVRLHHDPDDGVLFITKGRSLLEFEIASRALRTPQ